MCMHALTWTLENNMKDNTTRWIVRGFLAVPVVHYDPLITHVHVSVGLISLDTIISRYKV